MYVRSLCRDTHQNNLADLIVSTLLCPVPVPVYYGLKRH